MEQNEHRRISRTAIAHVGACSIRKLYELRRRRRVFCFQRGARNVRVAEIVERASQRDKNN